MFWRQLSQLNLGCLGPEFCWAELDAEPYSALSSVCVPIGCHPLWWCVLHDGLSETLLLQLRLPSDKQSGLPTTVAPGWNGGRAAACGSECAELPRQGCY